MYRDMYYKMAIVHTKNDAKVGWKELGEAQKLLRSHGRSTAKIYGLGEKKGPRNMARCYQNLSS